MAMTLAQLAQLEKGPTFKNYILTNLIRVNPLFQTLPFENVSTLRTVAVRWRQLPTVAFRKIGAGYTANEGQFEQVWESVYGFGGDMQFDRVFDYLKGNTVKDPKREIIDQKLMAMKIKFNDYLINGDHGTDADGFEGFKKRLSLFPTRQSVYFAGSGATAALDPTASVANGNLFYTKLEEIKAYTNDGNVSAWFMNLGLKLGLGRVIRYIQASGGNWLGAEKDVFGRDQPTLWGAPVYDCGLKEDQSTEVEAAEADDAGTATNAVRVYAISTDAQQGIQGIQLNEMTPYDPLNGGEEESIPSTLTRIDWWIGLTSFGSYGLAQGTNVEPSSAWTG